MNLVVFDKMERSTILLNMTITTCLHGHPQKLFQGGEVDILHIFSRLLPMQCKLTLTKRFTLVKPQRKCPM